MNDIDKKLWEKFEMFEEIDRAVQSKYGGIYEENRPKKVTSEDKFDQLYNYKKARNPSRSPQFKPNITNSYTTKDSEDNLVRKARNNNDINTIKSNKPSRKLSPARSIRTSSPVGDRLYALAAGRELRIEQKRQALERSRVKSPQITKKAKEMKRDPMKFHERLYPRHLSKDLDQSGLSDDSFDSKVKNIYKRPKKVNEQPNFKPELNRKSLEMASKLGSFENRLAKSNVSKDKIKSVYEIKRQSSRSPSKRLDEIYVKGKVKYNERAKKKAELDNMRRVDEIKDCSFHPSINKSRSRSRSYTPEKFFEKEVNWKKKIDRKTQLQKDFLRKSEEKELKFKPNTSKEIIEDDEEMINRNVEKINEYASKRRLFLQKQVEEKEFIRKKFNPGENYQGVLTKPKEFKFSTEQRKKSRSKSTERNASKTKGEKVFARSSQDDDEEFLMAVAKLHSNIARMKI